VHVGDVGWRQEQLVRYEELIWLVGGQSYSPGSQSGDGQARSDHFAVRIFYSVDAQVANSDRLSPQRVAGQDTGSETTRRVGKT
jgi:hypothetical protein